MWHVTHRWCKTLWGLNPVLKGLLKWIAVCCSVLHCAAVCCSALQCVAVRCSVLQCHGVLQCITMRYRTHFCAVLEVEMISLYAIILCHTSQWVMSRVDESCHMSMSHVTCRRVMSHVNGSCHISMGPVKCQWVMSHMKWYRSMGESRHIKGHMSHVILSSCPLCRRHITYKKVGSRKNESCRIKIKDAKHESRHTYIYGTHL